MIKIAPSLLAADPLNLGNDARRMTEAGCDWLHVDVMDAHFVPNLAFSPDTVRGLKKIAGVPLDVHLMMDDPGKYLDVFLEAGADWLTIHAEASGDMRELLNRIRRGEADPKPVQDGAQSPCAWCDHPDACRFDTTIPGCRVTEIDHKSREPIKGLSI